MRHVGRSLTQGGSYRKCPLPTVEAALAVCDPTRPRHRPDFTPPMRDAAAATLVESAAPSSVARHGAGYGQAVAEQPGDGEVYLATDGRWYRWPIPTPFPSREAAQARDVWAVASPRMPIPGARPPAWDATPAAAPTGVARATAYLAVPLVGGPVVGGAIGWLVLPHSVESGCEGIGFGCTLAPANTALLLGLVALFFTVPGVGLAALGMRGLTSVWPWYRELKALAKAVCFVAVLAAPLVLIRVVGGLYYAFLG